MKLYTPALALSLLLVAGGALAHEGEHPPKTTTATQTAQPMEHSKAHAHDAMTEHGKADAEFAQLDANKDGKLSKAEIPAKHRLAAHFGMLDTDKNGSLSQAEFAKHHGM